MNQNSITDTHKRKESKHNVKENHRNTREEKKRIRKERLGHRGGTGFSAGGKTHGKRNKKAIW